MLAHALATPCVILLCGTLGSGKTTMTRGIASGFGLENPTLVHSPSFAIVNRYIGRCPIYHVDLYRITGRRGLRSVGLEDFFGSDGATVIEWGERLPGMAESAVRVELRNGGDDERMIRIHGSPQLRVLWDSFAAGQIPAGACLTIAQGRSKRRRQQR